jgi:hypothetical protein
VSGTKSVGYDYSEPPALLLYPVITIKKPFVGAQCENFVLSKEIKCKQKTNSLQQLRKSEI